LCVDRKSLGVSQELRQRFFGGCLTSPFLGFGFD